MNTLFNSDYYYMDEIQGAQRVSIRTAAEINRDFLRAWCKASPVCRIHVFGARYQLAGISRMVRDLATSKIEPLPLECSLIESDILEIINKKGMK